MADPGRIVRAEAFGVALPLLKPMLMAGVGIERAENLVLRLECADGTVGWGEAASAPTMTGDTLPGMLAAARAHLLPLLDGAHPRDRAALCARIGAAIYGNTGAKSAVETALLDLAARRLGVPLVELLGGARRDALAPMWLIGTPDPAEDAAEARAKVAAGFRFLKLKVGMKEPALERASARAIRDAVGPGVALCADANMGLSVPDARAFAAAAREAGFLFLEQPCRHDDLAGMAAVAREGLPLGADEGIHGIADIAAHAAAGAAQGASLKPIKLGGLLPTLEAVRECGRHGWGVNLASKVAESSLAAAAILHLGAAIADAGWGVSLTHLYLAEDLCDPLPMRDGRIAVPAGPGLGVAPDEGRLRRLAIA